MFCINCGTKLEGQPKFCHRCGQPVTQFSQPSPSLRAEPAVAVSGSQPGRWRRRLLGCSAFLLVVVLACGAAAATLYFRLGLHETNQTAEIAPADTVALVAFSPSLLQTHQLYHLADSNYRAAVLLPVALLPGVVELGQRLGQQWPQAVRINFANDVLPWIGREVSLVVLDASGPNAGESAGSSGNPALDSTAYTGPPLLLTAVTRNPGRSTTFLVKVRGQLEEEGFAFENSVYKGILLTNVVSPTQVSLAYASFDNLVVLATDVNALHTAIDTATDEQKPALAEQATFAAMLDSLPANRLGHVYLDLPAILEQWPQPMRPWYLDNLSQAGMAVTMTGNGVRYAYALQYDPTALSAAQEEWLRQTAVPNRLAEQAPANSVLYFAGPDLLLFEDLFLGHNDREDVQALQGTIGIDVVRDLLSLAPTEFAWIILHDSGGLSGNQDIPVGLLLLAQVDDPNRVRSHLIQMFEQLGRADGDVVFYQDEMDRIPVWFLEEVSGESVGFGFLDETLFLGTSRDVLRTAVRAGRVSLANRELFQAATRPLSDQGSSYLYLDVTIGLRLLDRLLADNGLREHEELRPYLEQMRAISAVTTPMDQAGVVQGVVYVLID
jgi:hypothetical protein